MKIKDFFRKLGVVIGLSGGSRDPISSAGKTAKDGLDNKGPGQSDDASKDTEHNA